MIEASRASALIAVITFRRPMELERCLDSIFVSLTRSQVWTDVCIFNNAPEILAGHPRVRVVNVCAGGIASGRNAALSLARESGYNFLIFVDDDEVVDPNWLVELLTTKSRYPDAAAVTGPVQPPASASPDHYLSFARREHPDGTIVSMAGAGNLLLDLTLIGSLQFDSRFESGGEDTDFTCRLSRAGMSIRWSAAARITEPLDLNRLRLSYQVNRAWRSGGILRRASGPPRRAAIVCRFVASVCAGPLFPLALLGPRLRRYWLEKFVKSCGYFATHMGLRRRASCRRETA